MTPIATPTTAPAIASEKRALPLLGRPVGRYTSLDGRPRELVARPGCGGSVLVIDRDAGTLCDRRLVAHLAPDEPAENVAIVCDLYLEDSAGRWCRRIEREDLERVPFLESQLLLEPLARRQDSNALEREPGSEVIEALGCLYRLMPLPHPGSSVRVLRWARRLSGDMTASWEPASLRELVGALESYEPPFTLTATALARYRDDPCVSVTRLRAEFERMCASPIVLNRGLREAVLQAVSVQQTSLSEIAYRCGMIKHDRRGRPSGESSWLARRIGLMPEGGERSATPWVHSEVLALIARRGLGLSPREVEL